MFVAAQARKGPSRQPPRVSYRHNPDPRADTAAKSGLLLTLNSGLCASPTSHLAPTGTWDLARAFGCKWGTRLRLPPLSPGRTWGAPPVGCWSPQRPRSPAPTWPHPCTAPPCQSSRGGGMATPGNNSTALFSPTQSQPRRATDCREPKGTTCHCCEDTVRTLLLLPCDVASGPHHDLLLVLAVEKPSKGTVRSTTGQLTTHDRAWPNPGSKRCAVQPCFCTRRCPSSVRAVPETRLRNGIIITTSQATPHRVNLGLMKPGAQRWSGQVQPRHMCMHASVRAARVARSSLPHQPRSESRSARPVMV